MSERSFVSGALVVTAVALAALVPAPTCASSVAEFDRKMSATETVATDGLTWIDGQDLPIEGRAFSDTATYYERLPAALPAGINGGVRRMKRHTSGMQFRFSTDSGKLVFKWSPSDTNEISFDHMPATGASGIDVYRFDESSGRWRFVKTGRIADPSGASLEVPWRPGEICLVNLPLYNGLKSFKVGIEPGTGILQAPPRRNGITKPVVFYGTSITQGGCASRPGMSFVNIIGRALDIPVVNLGFSGSGVMEKDMSDVLAQIDASCYVLDCLWNMGTTTGERARSANGSKKGRNVEENCEIFVRNLRAKRPGVPIILAEQSDIFMREPNVKDLYLRDLYDRLVAEGWQSLYYLPKTKMYPANGEGTVDGVHPNDLGMTSLARAFGSIVAQALHLRLDR